MIMAGTSEARKIIKELSFLNFSILATTTTNHGAELARTSGANKVIRERLDASKLAEIIKNNDIEILVDATHPFAVEATRNAIKAADKMEVDYLRFERSSTPLPESDIIYKCASFNEAVDNILKLVKDDGRILHLAGVMTLHYLTEKIDPERIVARILPADFSLKKCQELGLPTQNIIAMEGTFSKEFNQALMEEYDISIVVTKDSGESGGTPSKIEAALDLKIPVIIIRRPLVSELRGKKVFSNMDSLIEEIIKLKEKI